MKAANLPHASFLLSEQYEFSGKLVAAHYEPTHWPRNSWRPGFYRFGKSWCVSCKQVEKEKSPGPRGSGLSSFLFDLAILDKILRSWSGVVSRERSLEVCCFLFAVFPYDAATKKFQPVFFFDGIKQSEHEEISHGVTAQ